MVEEVAEQTEMTVTLKHDYYRDGYYRAVLAFILILIAFFSMVAVSIWLAVTKTPPTTFITDEDWRVLQPIPLSVPYPPQPDLMQWITDALPKAFTVDFVNYPQQIAAAMPAFTPNGWKKFLEQANPYIAQSAIVSGQWFVNANPAGAPIIINQGLLQGSYGWWIQMPMNLSYSGAAKGDTVPLVVQVLVIRVPTLNDLQGVRIDNIILKKGTGDQIIATS
ncbi:MAG: DotI/IcmL/TraM family protein [Gammaproteobacteria bacterium]|nr:DotI/IcmL/TraM family protein [Gammaproteobacteria bacterium]